MIRKAYITKVFRDHLALITFSFVLLGLLQLLILSFVSNFQLLEFMQDKIQFMPEALQNFFGEEFFGKFSLKGVVAFGYNHPLLIALLGIISVILPAKHISGEIENGNFELLCSLPIKRLTISLSLWAYSCVAVVIVICGCWTGTLVGSRIFLTSPTIPLSNLFKIGINLWLLMICINAFSFLISAFNREAGKAGLISGGLILFFYFLNYISKIWSPLQSFEWMTPFNYYQPQKVMLNLSDIGSNIIILASTSLLLLLGAFLKINKRDIPA